MKHLNPDVRGPVSAAAIGVPGLMQAGNARILAGMAVTGGGAAAFLSDLIARIAAWG